MHVFSYMAGLQPPPIIATACMTLLPSHVCYIDIPGYIYYIEILGAKTFLLKATMASEIHATAKTFDLKCAK